MRIKFVIIAGGSLVNGPDQATRAPGAAGAVPGALADPLHSLYRAKADRVSVLSVRTLLEVLTLVDEVGTTLDDGADDREAEVQR